MERVSVGGTAIQNPVNGDSIQQPPQTFTFSNKLAKYKVIEKVGEGTYGVVFKAIDITTGKMVAIKRIRLEREEEGVPSTTLREIALLKQLSHPNVVKLYEVVHDSNQLNLIFEFVDSDLKAVIDKQREKKQYFPPITVKQYMFQMIHSLAYCHSNRVLHRDIKPQNILIDSEGNVKLADFGLAREFNIPVRTLTKEVITLWYRCPELLLGANKYSTAVDLWSIGCIFAELVSLTPLFPSDSEIDHLFKVFQLLGTPNEDSGIVNLPNYRNTFPKWKGNLLASKFLRTPFEKDALGLDLLARMLTINPAHRISAHDALKHPYFDELLNC
ncbi:hypothetical protein C9374_008308 [Naegleria lovaniensis]|uniref:cyclin-dependent kinase n=1 Tax=Naegleria lovaniensis TaxID=51637 RepID=A0AA88GJN2_NAELO|nr:uncharacterized protein C9374_008308 [Naegleria lovaniensis]KAG2378421.1 hypothetical protein C9374_008308 [Naegleria lovaniensis]